MHMGGEQRIAAPRETVWAALNDADILRRCIPGCEKLERVSDTELDGVVNAKVGPVQARFKGNVTLSEMDPPHGYRISGEGKGGAAGFARGGAAVRLTAEDNRSTLLSYEVDAKVGGKLAQVGQRLVDQTARKMADDFFRRFNEEVARPAEVPADVPVEETAPLTTGEPAAAPAEPGVRRQPPAAFWLALILALVALVLYFIAWW